MTLGSQYEDDFLADEPAGGLEMLLHEIETRWAELGAAARGLTDAECDIPDVAGIWSVKEVLGHVAAWEQEAARRIEAIVHGEGMLLSWPTREEEDAFNAAAVERLVGRTLDDVVKRLEEAHRDFIDLLASFGEEVMTAELEVPAMEWIPGWTYLHYQEHAPQIWALKNSLRRDV